MKLLLKPRDSIVEQFYIHHKHQYNDDAGFDIFCPDSVVFKTGETKLLDLGIQCYSVDKKPYLLIPRSSLWKKRGLILLNSVGLIDKQYTGTIKAPLGFFTGPEIDNGFVFGTIMATLFIAYLMASFQPFIIYCFFHIIMLYRQAKCKVVIGEALFQLVSFDGERIEIEVVDELPETDRGDHGFGSTTS